MEPERPIGTGYQGIDHGRAELARRLDLPVRQQVLAEAAGQFVQFGAVAVEALDEDLAVEERQAKGHSGNAEEDRTVGNATEGVPYRTPHGHEYDGPREPGEKQALAADAGGLPQEETDEHEHGRIAGQAPGVGRGLLAGKAAGDRHRAQAPGREAEEERGTDGHGDGGNQPRRRKMLRASSAEATHVEQRQSIAGSGKPRSGRVEQRSDGDQQRSRNSRNRTGGRSFRDHGSYQSGET